MVTSQSIAALLKSAHISKAKVYIGKERLFIRVPRNRVSEVAHKLGSKLDLPIQVLPILETKLIPKGYIIDHINEDKEIYTAKQAKKINRLNNLLRKCSSNGYPNSSSYVLNIAQAIRMHTQFVQLTGLVHKEFAKWHGTNKIGWSEHDRRIMCNSFLRKQREYLDSKYIEA